MFILFGTKGTNDFKGVYWGTCSRCNQKAPISVFSLVRWFTLFFIPLIPYSTKYYIKCNGCGSEWMASNEEKEKINEIDDEGNLLDAEEFKEKYKKQIEEKKKKAQELSKKFVEFVEKEAKKNKTKKKTKK